MKTAIVTLLFIAGFVLAEPHSMPISVSGNGATQAQNSSGTRLQATIGQPLARRVVSAESSLRGGFWPTMRAELFSPVGESQVTLPNRIEFHAAYPNPFNPSTSLSFSLPKAGEIRLELFDITGRSVASLADGEYAAGTHRLNWNADLFASGTYFARLQTGGYSHTQKLHLIK